MRDREGVVHEMEDDPGQDAPAPHRQETQDDPQERRVEELLKQAQQHVQEPEHQGRQQDRRPGPVLCSSPERMKPRNANSSQIAGIKAKTTIDVQSPGDCA